MTRFYTPNFNGKKALILHRNGESMKRLTRQLERLGMQVTISWPEFPKGDDVYQNGELNFDMVFVDADNGYDELFPWLSGAPPVPLIALLGSELPGRLEWAMSQNIVSHISKPIQSSGVFSALVFAVSNFEKMKIEQVHLESLEMIVSSRPAVLRGVSALMKHGDLNEDQAFALIRKAAMDNRTSIEKYCLSLNANIFDKLLLNSSKLRKPKKVN
ncbi:MAG: ANTAR domain-containing protein [Rhizobiales bacterium]|nr:ANTAR domain-containing protein [Hyphomicrobiales bacterium]